MVGISGGNAHQGAGARAIFERRGTVASARRRSRHHSQEEHVYVNVGAKDRAGERFKTKAALRRALEVPSEVLFDPTSLHGGGPSTDICADSIPTGLRLVVVGPDPYTHRQWYAQVARHGGKPRLT